MCGTTGVLGGKLNIQEKTKKKKKNERGKHDQKASNDIADWKWEKRRVTTRRVAATYYSNARNREQEKKKMQIENAIRIP